MAKTSKSFRLSEQALEHLQRVVNLTGTNETAIVEQALAYYAHLLSQNPELNLVQPGSRTQEQEKPVQQNSGGGRKRHKSKR